MKKLGKKNHEMIETVEAYCSCNCLAVCSCSCSCHTSSTNPIYYSHGSSIANSHKSSASSGVNHVRVSS